MSGVEGVIASAVGKQLLRTLGKFASAEISLQWRYREDVLDMEEKMRDVEAVLGDADEKLRREGEGGRVFQRFLTKFKRVAYDAEDVLDELETKELIMNQRSKVKVWFSTNNQLLHRITMPHKIKNVVKKIDQVEEEGSRRLNLVRRETKEEGRRNNEYYAASSGDGLKTGMVGRDDEKEKIISLLLKSEANQDISIIPVVGIGGIGKTTLVEAVRADKRVSIFDVSVCVNVSKLDLDKIRKVILKSINVNIDLANGDLQFHLNKELSIRRYLIVLDDLWEEDVKQLEKLKEMLQHGRKGSRILVTTRNLSVVQQLRTGFLANKICPVADCDIIDLGVLSSDDCWELMKRRAFGTDDDYNGLEEIGRKIAEKCGGLPLVANALGQVMSYPRTARAWEEINDTKVDLVMREGHQKEALDRLMLSYYYMKIEIKMCFAYLAAFPKGFLMDSNHLIQQWNALGYIDPGHDGKRCINYLLGMSFLHIPGSTSFSPSPLHFNVPSELVMHDLAHDLASIIVADEYIDLDATKSTRWNRARYCRHAQLTNFKNDPKVFKKIPRKLRSLHFRDLGGRQLPKKAFSRSKYIRVLDLCGHAAKGQYATSGVVFPSSVKRLILIRYLDATGLPITSIPKHFRALQNMETLILSNSLLETLPNSICRLSQLSYLDLSDSGSLSKLPASLGELAQLFFLNISRCSVLQELPRSICELSRLYHLDMSDCCAIQKLPDEFGSLKLSFLNMSNCSRLTKLPDHVSFPCLEHLNLSSCHELENLPIGFGHLPKLWFLNLSGCYKVSVLPESFCELIRLKHLDLSDCHNLKELPECLGHLLELGYLNLTSCSKLKQLPNSLCNLIKLRCLYLSYCLGLQVLPSSFGDLRLQILHMNGLVNMPDCPASIGDMISLTQLVANITRPAMSSKLEAIRARLNIRTELHRVHEIESRGCSSLVDLVGLTCSELVLTGLQNVRRPEEAETVKLREKSDIRVLQFHWDNEGGEAVLERLIPPQNVEHFWLAGYASKDFPRWMSADISSHLPFLNELTLDGLEACDCLPPFGTLPNLRKLALKNIPNVRIVGKEFYGGEPCRKLRALALSLMGNLEEWWTTKTGEEEQMFLIPDLHYLGIEYCPKLKFLPYPPSSMSWVLHNNEGVLPEGGFGNISSYISPCKLLVDRCSSTQYKWDALQHFPTLETFELRNISGLRTLPEAMLCLTSLIDLSLTSLEDLETLPIWLGQLASLQVFSIQDCKVTLTSFPESMKNLTALKTLRFIECEALEALPEWLGQLTCLVDILICHCPKLASMPRSIRNLPALKITTIARNPNLVGRIRFW